MAIKFVISGLILICLRSKQHSSSAFIHLISCNFRISAAEDADKTISDGKSRDGSEVATGKSRECPELEAGEVDARFYSVLGHLNLLVEDYPKGMFTF